MDLSANLYIASSEIDDRILNHFAGLPEGCSVAVSLRDVTDADLFKVVPLREEMAPVHEVMTNGVMITCPDYAPGCALGLEQENRIIAELRPAKPHGRHFRINLLDGVRQDRIHPVCV